jgi:hypothetical protein
MLVLAVSVGGNDPAIAQDSETEDAPMVVTSDTRAYCLSLSDRIDRYGTMPQEVRELETEGRELCEQGRVRGGINRLRRALMVLRAERGPAGESVDVATPDKNQENDPHE